MTAGATIRVYDVPAGRTADANLFGQAWAKNVILQSRNKDILGILEGGSRANKPIAVKTELTGGRHTKVHFTVLRNLGADVRRGDEILEGYEEKPTKKTFYVEIDQVRFAIAWSELTEHLMADGASAPEAYGILLGDKFGTTKEQDAFMSWLRYATPFNTIYAGDGGDLDSITHTDTMGTDTIESINARLRKIGAKAPYLMRDPKGPVVKGFTLLAPDEGFRPLRNDDRFLATMNSGAIPADQNCLLEGGYGKWDGSYVWPLDIEEEDTDGPIGSPLLPVARLGTAISAGTGAIDITAPGTLVNVAAGDVDIYSPFKFFPGYGYKLLSHETFDADTDPYYLVIWNETDKKYGVYKYTGSANVGTKIAGATDAGFQRLGPATVAETPQVATLAGQTWNAGVHTQAHPAGSLVFLVNAKCVPICYGLGLGAGSLLRAYGAIAMKRVRDRRDYDERKGEGFKSIFGQKPPVDTRGNPRGFVKFAMPAKHPGVTLTYS